ncbi:MAG TPA: LON peptidase substrate-binding domain-containing protein [Aldersonia sp.]
MTIMPMFPLGTVLLPGQRLPLQVFEPRYVALVDTCLHHQPEPEFGVVLISRGHEVGGGDERTDVGALARIDTAFPLPGNRFALDCVGTERIRVRAWVSDDPYPRAEVERWPDESGPGEEGLFDDVADRVRRLVDLASELAARSGGPVPDVDPLADLPADETARAYTLATRLPIAQTDRHALLRASGPGGKLARLAEAIDDLAAVLEFRLQAPEGGG